jgi:nicotinamidase-related amidase
MHQDRQGFALEGAPDAQFVDGLQLDTSVTPIVKRRDSAFFATTLDSLVFQLGTRQLLLGGLMASSCIAQTASDAYARDLQVTLLSDCIGDTSVRDKHRALKVLEGQLRQPIRSTEDFAAGLRAFDVPNLI